MIIKTGIDSSYNTVSTLFQVKPDHTPSKLLRSSVSLKTVSDSASLNTIKGIKKQIVLDCNFIVKDELLQNTEVQKERDMKQFVKNCTRNGILFNNTESNTPTSDGCDALLSNICVPKMHTGFLPYIPHPVTEFSTVYTALKKFLAVLSRLNQTRLPVFCDEGVNRIVADITHHKKDEFSGINRLLECFHMAKAAQYSIGKLIKHTGLDDALVETGAFGISIIESVTSGSHYDRPLRGLLILEDAVEALKWKTF